MAKRKRLTPPQQGFLAPEPQSTTAGRGLAPGPLSSAPIAQVAGEASATAALSELSQAMQDARSEGRLIETLPLGAIDPGHLVRDRLVQDEEEMQALITSLETRGQQTPIEVVALPDPRGGQTHGLISGWRRLTALQRLARTHADGRFDQVKALVVAPESMQAAYVAMVEENEIRADLSLYERARIAMRAYHEGIFPTQKAALQGLFDAVSRSKRSKINSFIPLVEALDGVLKFPAAIPEKLGLELARALNDDSGLRSAIYARLQNTPPKTPQDELDRLGAALTGRDRRPALPPVKGRPAPVVPAAPPAVRPRVTGTSGDAAETRLNKERITARFDVGSGRIELSGKGVDGALFSDLQAWLKNR